MSIQNEQRRLCERVGVAFIESPDHLKVGIAKNVLEGLLPINGLRHLPDGDTTGWYIWAGDTLSDAPDFFQPLHVAHLVKWCPMVLKYLGLAPGSRFLITPEYEDVWFDGSLLIE
jgi:hypothetical protein